MADAEMAKAPENEDINQGSPEAQETGAPDQTTSSTDLVPETILQV